MNFEQMVMFEPALLRLKHAAYHAANNGASWIDYLMASHEQLTKLVGRGAFHEELQSAQCYEVARRHLFEAWSKGSRAASPAVDVESSGQTAFISTSEVYR